MPKKEWHQINHQEFHRIIEHTRGKMTKLISKNLVHKLINSRSKTCENYSVGKARR